MSTVTLLDYGAGNVRSVRNAIKALGFTPHEVKTPDDIRRAEKLVFPGVGAFGSAIARLRVDGYLEPLREYLKAGRPFFGICIGLQALFEGSEESPGVPGLGIIPGQIHKFHASYTISVPQIGWNGIHREKPSALFSDYHGERLYFVHSYRAIPEPENRDWVLATTDYGSRFVSAVQRGNVAAVQFHPEKSGEAGLRILRNFLIAGDLSGVEDAPSRIATSPGGAASAETKLAKRIIACLDVRANDEGDLVVTKGDQYDVRESGQGGGHVRNLGKPVELARRYYEEGADEITFLNITGFRDFPLGDQPMLDVLRETSKKVFVPLTIGGGIREYTDANGKYHSSLAVAAEYFRSGADKVSIGSDAVHIVEEYNRTRRASGTSAIEQIAEVYGNQAVVISIDPRRVYVRSPEDVPFHTIKTPIPGPNGERYCWYQCTVRGGREGRPVEARQLAIICQRLGAGELLVNCIDRDGTRRGFDLELVQLIRDAVSIPVIASSGAGTVQHFFQVFDMTGVEAALAAGIFHRREVPIAKVKEHLQEQGIETRYSKCEV
uniref:Imidazole glycerol phosphate synthase subunit HisH n=1 Tax=Candidatus Kentrum sp. FM TaxID=2126340 RepID=A0A450WLM1_9GAMM|nr:MAG: glutamine amidotransferase / cyclase [Candidatus Kentron sp. FM]VFJ65049.1 MAG: glutamine amidotransferase / cyclase [Candidatus Kentron sp. FM]VFK17904.1 MAG: glutamine amidotransferase / cyclase [Candidatus Kentron sp. FM]